MKSQIKRIHVFYREDNKQAVVWNERIHKHLKGRYQGLKFDSQKPQAVIVLGGDGTILEASRMFQKVSPVILGLNLGHVGFLASARSPGKFLKILDIFLKGEYKTVERMMLNATVLRNDKPVFTCDALNEVSVQNPLGMVELKVYIEDHQAQSVHGTGVMVATATGSTAYNLSAHGPIVMPDIKGFILTEILDHNIPTPSIVIKHNRKIFIEVSDFRKRELLSVSSTNEKIDVILFSDGETIFPLLKGDIVKVRQSNRLIKFAELEKHYFFKSLEEKFSL